MKTILTLITAMLVLTGCATNPEYMQYVKAQADIAVAQHATKAAKYKAMADIAVSGGESAKSNAMMALALDERGAASQTPQLQAPQASTALQWAQVLVPGFTQVAGIAATMRVGIAQSNNAARVAESTNNTFSGIASQIQAAPTITTTTTNTDRHDTLTPAPVVVNVPTPLVPVVVNPPTVITPVVQITPVITP